MKASYHNSRDFGSARHNDRDFDLSKAEHIDKDQLKKNIYITIYPGETFRDTEIKFYRENFGAYVDDINERRKKSHHKGVKKRNH